MAMEGSNKQTSADQLLSGDHLEHANNSLECSAITGSLLVKLSEYHLMNNQHTLQEIESILLQIARRCRKDEKFTSHLAHCFASNSELLTTLVAMINNIFLEKKGTITYIATSCTMLTHEVFRMLTDSSKAVLVAIAKVGFVHTMLMELQLLAKNLEYTKILELVVTSIFGLIQNFAAEPIVLMHFKSTKFIKILSAYLDGNNKGIYFMCLLTLALLTEITDHQKWSILALNSEEICGFVEILCDAASEDDFIARNVYGSLVVPVNDLLILLKYLCYVEINHITIKEQLPFILMSIELCINNGKDDHKLAALDLLWSLMSSLSRHSASDLGITESLIMSIDNLSKRNLPLPTSSMALCILHSLKPVDIKDLSLLMALSEGCYKHRRYDQCIQWNQSLLKIVQKSENYSLEAAALALRGKSYFHIYRREQQILEEAQPNLSRKELHLRRATVYNKTERAINDLGDAIERNSSSMDHEVAHFLDISIVDLAIQTNGLKDIGRCLLCRQKSKLLRSHLCPDSVLRAFATGLEKTQNKRIFNLSFYKDSEMKSPHKIVKWLFCQKCEEILCQDGEVHFVPKFFKKIYDIDNYKQPTQGMTIDYDEWLYRFALGIIFKSLINEAITSFMNEEEIYTLFTTCRKLLLTKGSLDGLEKPPIYLLVSPLSPSTDAGFIGHIHNSPFLFALTNVNIKTGERTVPANAHFILSRIGILNFLLLFKSDGSTLIPDEYIIHSKQGKYVVPPENDRAAIIPKGITSILDDLAVTIQKNFLEVTTTAAKGLSLSEISPPSDSAKEVFYTLPGIKHDVDGIEKGLPVTCSIDNPQELNLLPKGMDIQHSNRSVLLPASHSIIAHGTFTVDIQGRGKYKATLFLICGDSPQSPYVILHYRKPGLTVYFGFVLSPDNLMPINLLQDVNPKLFLPLIVKQLNAADHIKKVLPAIMKAKGLKTYHTIVHHSYLNWPVRCYDMVCYKRCWYCEDRCNNCLKLSTFSFNVDHPNIPMIKSCSKACQNVYLTDSPLLQPPLLMPPQDDAPHLLLLSVRVPIKLGSEGYSRSYISVYLGDGSKPFPRKDAYIVFQHRTPFEQTFLEYFLQNDSSFSHPLKYYGDKDLSEILQSNDIVFAKLVLQTELKKMGIKDLNELIEQTFQ